MADCGANETAYIPTDLSAKNVNSFCWLARIFLQDSATLCGFYLSLNRKLNFFFCPLTWFLWIFFFFCRASVVFFCFISWETSGFPWALGAGDSVCGAVDKWGLFGVTLSHSQAINLLQSKQQLSSTSLNAVNTGQGELMRGWERSGDGGCTSSGSGTK